MSAYTDACLVEQRGMAVLLPFLESRAWRGQVIRVAKGPLARHFQRSFGDLLIATGPGNVASVEIKAQRRWTGNLFLEVWSNNAPGRIYDVPEPQQRNTYSGMTTGRASCRSKRGRGRRP